MHIYIYVYINIGNWPGSTSGPHYSSRAAAGLQGPLFDMTWHCLFLLQGVRTFLLLLDTVFVTHIDKVYIITSLSIYYICVYKSHFSYKML